MTASQASRPQDARAEPPHAFAQPGGVQADYIGVPVEGPYKPDHYRY